VRGTDDDLRAGLVGFISLFVGNLIVDGVTLRITRDRRFVLSWPARTDRAGRRHSTVRPVDDEVRRRIEREILGQLGQHVAAETGQEADDA
jgi:hypothetical protein